MDQHSKNAIGTPEPEELVNANTKLRKYWAGRAYEAELQVEQLTAEVDRLRAMCDQWRRDFDRETGKRIAADLDKGDALAKVSELEQTLSIVRGDLATAERARSKAEGDLYAELERGTEHNRVMFDYVFDRQRLQSGLSAANNRAARAERKAAKANTELDAMRKHARALANVVELRETVSQDCTCEMCRDARAALDYLKQPKE